MVPVRLDSIIPRGALHNEAVPPKPPRTDRPASMDQQVCIYSTYVPLLETSHRVSQTRQLCIISAGSVHIHHISKNFLGRLARVVIRVETPLIQTPKEVN